MATWYVIYDSIFFIALAGILCGGIHYAVKSCYKSKCYDIDICYGCLRVKRDIDAEQQIDNIPPNNDEENS
jgi:hypothetical protein